MDAEGLNCAHIMGGIVSAIHPLLMRSLIWDLSLEEAT
jgi:hypothetical protein